MTSDPKLPIAGRVEPEIYEAVMRLAGAEERTQSQMVRLLVREALRQRGALPTAAPQQEPPANPTSAPPTHEQKTGPQHHRVRR